MGDGERCSMNVQWRVGCPQAIDQAFTLNFGAKLVVISFKDPCVDSHSFGDEYPDNVSFLHNKS